MEEATAARFWAKVRRTGTTCWNWQGARQSRGYGSFGIAPGRTALAHRVAYEAMVGPIPDGMTLDHLCENKVCVNPAHLEPVTREENTRRHAEAHRGSHYCDRPGCSACAVREQTTAKVRRSKARARAA